MAQLADIRRQLAMESSVTGRRYGKSTRQARYAMRIMCYDTGHVYSMIQKRLERIMATQDAGTGDARTGGLPDPNPVTAALMPVSEHDWLIPAVFIIGAFAALGLVVVVFGAYLTPSITTVVIGVAIMLVAATAWVIAALYLIGGILKRLFTPRRATIQ